MITEISKVELIGINQLTNCCGVVIKVCSMEVANIVIRILNEVFYNFKYKKQLIEKFNIADFEFQIKNHFDVYELTINFKHYNENEKALLDFSKVLICKIKTFSNTCGKLCISKITLKQSVETKISVVNLWKFECQELLTDILSSSMVTQERLNDLKSQNNMLNHFLYFSTTKHISKNLELYKKEDKHYMKIHYTKNILELLQQVDKYIEILLSNNNYTSYEAFGGFKFSELKRSNRMVKKMLTIDFE